MDSLFTASAIIMAITSIVVDNIALFYSGISLLAFVLIVPPVIRAIDVKTNFIKHTKLTAELKYKKIKGEI